MGVLTVNAGSSSIKFAAFTADGAPAGNFEIKLEEADQASRLAQLWLAEHLPDDKLTAVGHRIVHGGPNYFESCLIDETVLADLEALAPFDPEHLPVELSLVKHFLADFLGIPQVACFDTAFHHNLPDVARRLPIPRKYDAQGVRRYGFHGLSYSYLMGELARQAGPQAAQGRVVIAHLGNGSSLAAIKNGQPVDTTMGLTPTGGITMSSRSGDLDPGLFLYFIKNQELGVEALSKMFNFESGLLGISETSSDMKHLLEIQEQDPRAADAVNLFCYQVRKQIGAYAAAMGGLDSLIFSAGMGENAPKIRAQACQELEFLGLKLDQSLNDQNAAVISTPDSQVAVRVIHTNEAKTIYDEIQKLTRAAA